MHDPAVPQTLQTVIREAMEWGRQYLSPASEETIEDAVQHYAEKAAAARHAADAPASVPLPDEEDVAGNLFYETRVKAAKYDALMAARAAEPDAVTSEMVRAGMRWIVNWSHMRTSDKQSALREAFKAMLGAWTPEPEVAATQLEKYIALAERCGAEIGRYEGEMVWMKFHRPSSVEAFVTGITMLSAVAQYRAVFTEEQRQDLLSAALYISARDDDSSVLTSEDAERIVELLCRLSGYEHLLEEVPESTGKEAA